LALVCPRTDLVKLGKHDFVRHVLAHGVGSFTTEEVARAFTRAKRTEVEEVLHGLAALGLAVSFTAGGARRWRAAGCAAA
jgi:hypothetical protein